VKRALFLPPFDDLADVRVLAGLAAEAELAGWDGVFLWDHVLRPDPPRPVADPWIALAALAMRTERVRLGTMVTPLARRRPQKLAREVATLDHLSGGRVTLGLGLGVDTGRELSGFGEPVIGAAERGDLLDEGLPLLRAMLRGERIDHHGRFFTADGVTLVPSRSSSARARS
jgi:alkanesulfonate monooxygenase SsuD/methylene tetrahydromethanopterin reductase-like flavin-dependent oxidoreductase (luciferase family)